MIYNAPSIYKQGGGGGYNDGGALVDGDFIKVENNTVSSYDNTARSDINFYFDVNAGVVLNSIIELTNEYNATVHIYILQNGYFIPLGNVGGDTVNAGDDYKINIVGNSFMLELLTPSQADPEAVILDGVIYPCKKFGSLLWMTSELQIENFSHKIYNGVHYYLPNLNINVNGWRLPNDSEFSYIINTFTSTQLKDVTTWATNGNNESGFNWHGYSRYYNDWEKLDPGTGQLGTYLYNNSNSGTPGTKNLYNDGSLYSDGIYPGMYYTVRLVKEV